MCGRATLVVGVDEIREIFELQSVPELTPRYNIAPTQPLPVIRTPGVLELLPFGGAKARFINAKLESVTKKPENRCLVVVDGFYEWRDTDKQPFHFRRSDGKPFALGGVTRSTEPGAAIVTCAAMVEMVDIHDRQPVVLSRDDWSAWLAGEVRAGSLAELIRYPVSKVVNNWRNDDERCLGPPE